MWKEVRDEGQVLWRNIFVKWSKFDVKFKLCEL
jgi:hypothetical protein